MPLFDPFEDHIFLLSFFKPLSSQNYLYKVQLTQSCAFPLKICLKPGMVTNAFNPSIEEAEVGGSVCEMETTLVDIVSSGPAGATGELVSKRPRGMVHSYNPNTYEVEVEESKGRPYLHIKLNSKA